jgi:hypothetical protein
MLRRQMPALVAAVTVLSMVACGTGPSEPMPPGDMPMQIVVDSLQR